MSPKRPTVEETHLDVESDATSSSTGAPVKQIQDDTSMDFFSPFPDNHIFRENNPLSFRAILTGVLLGALVNASSIYLGLKAGLSPDASVIGTVIGFILVNVLIKTGVPFLSGEFGPSEHNIIQTVAQASGGLSTPFISAVPMLFQLDMLDRQSLGSQYWKLVTITAGASLFGTALSVPMRRIFVISLARKLNLVFPNATGIAGAIHSMHLRGQNKQTSKASTLLYLFMGGSIVWVVCSSYAKGILYSWDIFWWFYAMGGYKNLAVHAVNWGFIKIQWSPALFGMGMLVNLNVAWSWLFGYVVAYGIIGPILVATGGAVGFPYSKEYPELMNFLTLATPDPVHAPTPMAWIMWPCVMIMVCVSVTDVLCNWRVFLSLGKMVFQQLPTVSRNCWMRIRRLNKDSKARPVIENSGGGETKGVDADPAPVEQRTKSWEWSLLAIFGITLGCALLSTQLSFPVGLTLLSLLFSAIFAVFAIQCAGQTGVNMTFLSAAGVQIIVAAATVAYTKDIYTSLMVNILAGAVANCVVQQMCEMAADFKIGFLLSTPPRFQWYAQIIGCVPAIFMSPGIFILFMKAYDCVLDPEKLGTGMCEFAAPSVQAYRIVAQVIDSPTDLPAPASSLIFGLCASGVAVIIHVARHWARKKGKMTLWACMPNMLIASIGPLLPTTSYGIAIVGGCLAGIFWKRRNPDSYGAYFLPVAAGMLAGESIAGLINALLTLAKVSGPEYYGTTIGCPGGFCY